MKRDHINCKETPPGSFSIAFFLSLDFFLNSKGTFFHCFMSKFRMENTKCHSSRRSVNLQVINQRRIVKSFNFLILIFV